MHVNCSFTAIQIISSGNMSVGDNGSLLCRSIIPVDVIEWLNSDGEVIVSDINTSELSLAFAPVNTSIHNQMYTCRVNRSALVNKTTVISVTGKITNHTIMLTLFFTYKQWKILWK